VYVVLKAWDGIQQGEFLVLSLERFRTICVVVKWLEQEADCSCSYSDGSFPPCPLYAIQV
jgi:hypothetical protein